MVPFLIRTTAFWACKQFTLEINRNKDDVHSRSIQIFQCCYFTGIPTQVDAIGGFNETFAIDLIDARIEQCWLAVWASYEYRLGASPEGIVYYACNG